jgi:hypothetical protein
VALFGFLISWPPGSAKLPARSFRLVGMQADCSRVT